MEGRAKATILKPISNFSAIMKSITTHEAERNAQPFLTNNHLEDLKESIDALNVTIKEMDANARESDKRMEKLTTAMYVLTAIAVVFGVAQFMMSSWEWGEDRLSTYTKQPAQNSVVEPSAIIVQNSEQVLENFSAEPTVDMVNTNTSSP